MNKKKSGIVFFLLTLTSALFAATVTLEMDAKKAVKTTDAQGNEVVEYMPADKVLPGETVVYTISYTNDGDAPADNVVINNPVPEEMLFVGGSASGEETTITYSLDGEFFASASELTVTLPNGSSRAAEPYEFRYIRWKLNGSIEPQNTGTVSYQATLR